MHASQNHTGADRFDQHPSDDWTTRSKKEMALGFALILAGIGCEPVFFLIGEPLFLYLTLAILASGVYSVILGFRQQK